MVLSGQLDAAKGWVKQLHLGALRNTNTRKFRELGRDTGFDSIADTPQAATAETLGKASSAAETAPPTDKPASSIKVAESKSDAATDRAGAKPKAPPKKPSKEGEKKADSDAKKADDRNAVPFSF